MKEKRILMLGYFILKNDPRVLREAEALVKAGWEVEVLGLSDHGEFKKEVMPSGVVNRELSVAKYRGDSTFAYLRSYVKFATLAFCMVLSLRSTRFYGAVHVHTIPDVLVFCGLPIKLWGGKIVLDVHDTVPELYQDKFGYGEGHPLIRFLRWSESISTAFADQVITVNHEHCDLVKGRSSAKKEPAVVFNAVDEGLFRRKETLKPKPKHLMYHGTMAHRHGLDQLIEAMPAVLAQEPETKLSLYGSGDAVPDLIAKRDALGLQDSVYISAQHHPLSEMAELVQEADLGVIPYRQTVSTQYMMPTKLLEYMSVGLPVVCSITKPVASMLRDRVKIWESDDVHALAQLIIEQIRHPVVAALPESMKWSNHQQELINLYQNLKTA